jgi:hypothetical protein
MPDMNSTSASLYGSRPSPGGVACSPEGGALAQLAPKTVTTRNVVIAGRDRVLIPSPTKAWYAIRDAFVRSFPITCAKKGQPLALLTSDGKVYTIAGDLAANNNAKLIPHISHTVEITGDTMDMSGKMMITAADLKMISK